LCLEKLELQQFQVPIQRGQFLEERANRDGDSQKTGERFGTSYWGDLFLKLNGPQKGAFENICFAAILQFMILECDLSKEVFAVIFFVMFISIGECNGLSLCCNFLWSYVENIQSTTRRYTQKNLSSIGIIHSEMDLKDFASLLVAHSWRASHEFS
jgi:hypothetical protein